MSSLEYYLIVNYEGQGTKRTASPVQERYEEVRTEKDVFDGLVPKT